MKENEIKLKTALAESKQHVTCLKSELEKEKEKKREKPFWGKEKVPRVDKRGSSLQWRPVMRDATIKCLATGTEVTSIHKVLVNVAHGVGVPPEDVPCASTLREWRRTDMAVLNEHQLADFLGSTTQLILCLDDASYKDHKVRLYFIT